MDASAPPQPEDTGNVLRVLVLAAAAVVTLVGFAAGYRLYEKDRAETAAELVRIKAYLEVRAQVEAAPAKVRETTKAPATAALAVAGAEAKPRPAVEPAAHPAPKPRSAKAAQKPPPQQPVQIQAREPERQKSVDRIWSERVQRECAPGFVGLICREWLKLDVCREHDAWGKASVCPAAEKPPPSVPSGSLG